ncbi:hypothetical protein PEX1_002850 [Penicillium expansum]|uniref:Uncharacterized protein n=1 Tax=Penicillium expansum TaxID=27334 RepID=A0A0A2JWZ0_PENEN|nr:hypothetical protein PEX2_072180 [Penicillium expansum]KGO38891.1 hypothetical protein PEXP_050070 [Penicillium expansum]KGO48774.1 hypothetical protein PEX1_002850 [Penicillium expansum]KGO59143.1 hypothetical protein PEX2_072180 [Penicillium expansum]
MSAYTMSNVMSNAMSNKFSNAETDSEGHNSTPLPHGWRLPQPNDSSYVDAISGPLIVQSTLAPFLDAISALTPRSDYLSTGAPRLVPIWVRCCGCGNLVNPNLAPEGKCPICAHCACRSCGSENVP